MKNKESVKEKGNATMNVRFPVNQENLGDFGEETMFDNALVFIRE